MDGAANSVIDTTSDLSTTIKSEAGNLVVKREQDTTAYLDANRKEFNEAPSWRPYASGRRDKSMRKVASIPLIVIEQWMKEGVNIFDPSPEMQKKVAQKLNSNEFQGLRTYPGRVGYRT
jgi:hypothetical protein